MYVYLQNYQGKIGCNKGKKLNLSPEQRKAISDRAKARKGQHAWNKGLKHTAETREKMSKIAKEKNFIINITNKEAQKRGN